MTTATELRSTCTICQQPICWVDCPTGGWWRHDQHPADGHDADAVACPACLGSGECSHCADADSYACEACLCSGECTRCDGTGGTKEGRDFPPRGGHDALCVYAAGIGPRCTCDDTQEN